MAIKKLSTASQETQLKVISSNRTRQGSERISLIWSPHLTQGISVTRKCTQVGVGRGGCSMSASRDERTRNAYHWLDSARFEPIFKPGRREIQPILRALPRMSDNADNSASICASVPTVIRR